MMYLTLATSFILFTQCFCGEPWVGEIKDAGWLKWHNDLVKQSETHSKDIQIVFLGDSITWYWGDHGKDTWNKYYVPRHAYGYGIPGDRTEHVIYRIDNKELDKTSPKVVVLMIGTNNIPTTYSGADIAKGIHTIITKLEAKLPNSKILVLGVLPQNGGLPQKVQDINKIVAGYEDKKRVFFLNMDSHFMKDGKQDKDLFVDGLHPNAKGYEIWHTVMESLLKQLLG